MQINKRIRRNQMNQGELANKLKITQAHLNNIISGKQRLKVELALNMAKHLNCSGLELLAENAGHDPLDLASPTKAQDILKLVYNDLQGASHQKAQKTFNALMENVPDKVKLAFQTGAKEGVSKLVTAKGMANNQEEEQPEIRQGLIDGIYQVQPATKPFSKGDLETFTTDQLIKVAHSMGWNPEQWIKNQRGEGQAQNKENMPTPPPAVSGIETEEEWRARQKERMELHENRKERAHKEERERNLAGNEGTPEAPDIIMGNKTSARQEMEDHYKNPEAYKKKQNKPTNNNDEGAPEPPSVVLKKPKKDGEK